MANWGRNESRGKVHDYLVMKLEFSVKGKVTFRMDDYMQNMILTSPQKFNSTDMIITPAGDKLFNNDNGKPLGKSKAEAFYTMAAKDLFYQIQKDSTYIPQVMCGLLG